MLLVITMASTSIAKELINLINARKYKTVVPVLPNGGGLSENIFPKTIFAKTYALDISRWLDGSYMNPNAMFELFGCFNNETGMQTRRHMFKYLGVTKKHGAETSEILCNSWMALGMQGLNARKWSDAMFSRETPCDEIALYTLCRLFNCHCAVVTSFKVWSTLETDNPVTDKYLLEECDIQLLYIEPGVYGELKLKPAHPPAPHQTETYESAMDIVQKANDIETTIHVSPLNLSTSKTGCDDERDGNINKENMGNNMHTQQGAEANDLTINKDHLKTDKRDCYLEARLSGCLDRIRPECMEDPILFTYSMITDPPDASDVNPVNQANSSPDKVHPVMEQCIVKVCRLTLAEINDWSGCASIATGYNLRARVTIDKLSRFACKAKEDIVYVPDSDSSDYSVKPGKWSRRRSRNIYVPAQGHLLAG